MCRVCLITILVLAAFALQLNAQPTLNSESQKQLVMSNLSSMSLCFTENLGQWDEKALFKAEAGGATFWFCRDEVAHVFTRDTDEVEENPLGARHALPADMPDLPDKINRPRDKKESLVLRAQFVGSNPDAEIIGEDRLSHNNNYFIGNDPTKWATDVPNYSSVTYKNIYQGIDLKYHGDGKGMKYDFIVNPGVDIFKIRIRYDGVENLGVTNQGDLEAQTRFGPVYERIPQIYQEIAGQRREISGHYILHESGTFGFALEEDFNPAYPVIIDPKLVYSTYLGGNDEDRGYGIAVDGSGNAYVTGYTSSSDFPTQNPYQADQPSWDAFVTKLSPSGNSLVYSTYLGGNDFDLGYGIAVDGGGNAYITGYTSSTDFPTLNPYQTDQPDYDVFVSKLAPAGNSLVYSTYLGGNSGDCGNGIAVDGGGNAYITGDTWSTDFPTMNPYQTGQPGGDVFVTKLAPPGNSLVYSTYLGGNDEEHGNGIAVDSGGSAYITGVTSSTDFPTQNPYQTDQAYLDAFVTKLSPSGDSLVYGTYLGGNDFDLGNGIAVDGGGNAYITGYTSSTDFPTQNPYQTNQPGTDAFVTKLSPSGYSLVYSTYLGADWDDYYGYGIAVNDSGNAYVTGKTFTFHGSSATNFPTQNPYQTYQGPVGYKGFDAFVTKISPAGNSLVYSTDLGGWWDDYGYGIAVDSSGDAYVTGWTNSTDFPTQNPFQSYQGYPDAFVTKLSVIEFYTITGNAGPNGTISPSGVVSINYGSDTTFTITPNIGYHVLDVLVDGNSVGPVTSYTFSDVTANHTIAASFAIDQGQRSLWHVATTGNDTTGDGSQAYPFRTIQHGINVSSDGDTVLVAPGTYHENLTIASRGITLASHFLLDEDTTLINCTIIDADSLGPVIRCTGVSSRFLAVCGFTIRHGFAGEGGGLNCVNSNIVLNNNVLMENAVTYRGGAIYCTNCNASIIGNIIRNNIASSDGSGVGGGIFYTQSDSGKIFGNIISGNQSDCNAGGIGLYFADIPISHNVFFDNVASGIAFDAGGGAIWCASASPSILNNTICSNLAANGSAVFCEHDATNLQIRNSILWDNSAGQLYLISGAQAQVTYSDIQYGWSGVGNINFDPLFIESDSHDYHLQFNSPCIDAGDPLDPPDSDGSRIDLGALAFDRCSLQITTLLSPPSGAIADSSTWLTWLDPYYELCTQIRFQIQIDDDSMFTDPEIDVDVIRTPELILDGSFSLPLISLNGFMNLLNNMTYYWRVRSVNILTESFSEWCDGLHYFILNTINVAPNPPITGFSPTGYDETISLTPTISWDDATDPDPDDISDNLHYVLVLLTDTSFGEPELFMTDTTEDGINRITVTDTLPDNYLFMYQVKTVDDEGLESDWSAWHNFWTNHYNFPPEPFPLYAPGNGQKQVVYYTHFSWGHTVDYDPNSSFTFSIQYSPDSSFRYNIGTLSGLADTAISIVTDSLALSGLIYWRVLAIDDDSLSRIGGLPEGPRSLLIIPPGDANTNGVTNGIDATFMVAYLKGQGAAPDPIQAGDANGNCTTNGIDVVYLVAYLKGIGAAPRRPGCEIILGNRISSERSQR